MPSTLGQQRLNFRERRNGLQGEDVDPLFGQ